MTTRGDITSALIKQIADYHDASPTDYRDFEGTNGLVLATQESQLVDYARPLADRIGRAVDELGASGETELPIGDGRRCVNVSIKRPWR